MTRTRRFFLIVDSLAASLILSMGATLSIATAVVS